MSLINHYGRDPFDPIECAECAGSGLCRRATWAEPEEPCPHCAGTGLIDCNCPGLCRYYYPDDDDDEPECVSPSDPWARVAKETDR